jgi:hypothetical protein
MVKLTHVVYWPGKQTIKESHPGSKSHFTLVSPKPNLEKGDNLLKEKPQKVISH